MTEPHRDHAAELIDGADSDPADRLAVDYAASVLDGLAARFPDLSRTELLAMVAEQQEP